MARNVDDKLKLAFLLLMITVCTIGLSIAINSVFIAVILGIIAGKTAWHLIET